MPDLIVQARGLTKHFDGALAVNGINLNVPKGGCFGLLGPNGAGKTTTLKMILGQCRPSAGELRVLDQPMPRAARAVRARMGVVPQTDNLDPDLGVAENLEVYAFYFGLAGKAVTERIQRLLDMVELDARAGKRINQLSGGMKRRLSIARALVNDPEVLVLDEPTTGLDPQVRHLIWTRLRELKRAGKSMILTSHYMEEAERLCDELVIMDHGRIMAHGSPRTLIREHVEPDVIEIHACPPQVQSDLATLGVGRMEQVGETTYCFTREPRALLGRLEQSPEVSYLHRPANLEDVFLKLTGRELRE